MLLRFISPTSATRRKVCRVDLFGRARRITCGRRGKGIIPSPSANSHLSVLVVRRSGIWHQYSTMIVIRNDLDTLEQLGSHTKSSGSSLLAYPGGNWLSHHPFLGTDFQVH